MKYFFWGPEFKPAYAMFKEILNRDNVEYVRFIIPSYILVKIYDLVKMARPFVRKYIVKKVKNNGENAIFVYYNPWGEFMVKNGCLDLLKKKYKNSLHVVLLFDVIFARKMNIECLKSNYDRVYIYNQTEAEFLGISYFPPFYSKNFSTPSEEKETYDVSFVGHAKDRFKEIIEVYEKLTGAGLKCKFYIVGVNADSQKYKGEIIYEKRYLSEEEYFKLYIAPSKCLLEIGNTGTNALTARVREAVMYDKKILSNNVCLKKYKYYRDDMMQVYDRVENIDISFFKKEKHSYNYEGDFSPSLFLKELKSVYEEVNRGDDIYGKN